MSEPAAPTAAPAAPAPPELAPALALFDRGDFRGTRAAVAALLASSPSPEVAAAARALQARTESDPWALRIGLVALGLLALVIGIYVF